MRISGSYFLFLQIIVSLLSACKKDNGSDCLEKLHERYNSYERVQIESADRITYGLLAQDTAIFSYTGKDTLSFAVTDSNGIKDTVTFIGQGKNVEFLPFGNTNSSPCPSQIYKQTLTVNFVPQEPGYDSLKLKLDPDRTSTKFLYTYGIYQIWGNVDDIYQGNPHIGRTYYTYFAIDGHEFYSVNYFRDSMFKTWVTYYMNRDKGLFLFILPSNQKFLLIN